MSVAVMPGWRLPVQLKAEPTLKVGIQSKRRRAGWDLAYLGKVMGWGI